MIISYMLQRYIVQIFRYLFRRVGAGWIYQRKISLKKKSSIN